MYLILWVLDTVKTGVCVCVYYISDAINEKIFTGTEISRKMSKEKERT